MNKLTKVLATVGPSSESEEMIAKLMDLGVNVFRFNIKHNELAWHKEKVQLVKKVAEKKGVAVGTLLDLQGPEIRTVVPGDEIPMKKGDRVIVGTGDKYPTFTISHPSVIKYLQKGQEVVVEDGRARFEVVDVLKGGAVLEAKLDQVLKTKKNL